MPEETPAQTVAEGAPAGSQPAQEPAQEPAATPAAAAATAVPFDQDPKIRDYIDRQVKKGIESGLRAQPQAPAAQPADNDPWDMLAKEFTDDHELDPQAAKKLVSKIKKSVDIASQPMRERLNQFEMNARFAGIFSKYPDAAKHEKAMLETFERMDEHQKNVVLRSPIGPEYLYTSTLQSVNGGIVPEPTRIAGGNARGSSVSPRAKMDDKASSVNKMLDAFNKKDRQAFEQAVSNYRQ